jgi:hypothetical protein
MTGPSQRPHLEKGVVTADLTFRLRLTRSNRETRCSYDVASAIGASFTRDQKSDLSACGIAASFPAENKTLSAQTTSGHSASPRKLNPGR